MAINAFQIHFQLDFDAPIDRNERILYENHVETRIKNENKIK